MKFKIDNEIFESFPGLNIGVVVAKGISLIASTMFKAKRKDINTGSILTI